MWKAVFAFLYLNVAFLSSCYLVSMWHALLQLLVNVDKLKDWNAVMGDHWLVGEKHSAKTVLYVCTCIAEAGVSRDSLTRAHHTSGLL